MAESPETRAQALLERGATLYEGGKLYEALSCWKQVLQIDPENEIAAEYLRFIEDNFQIGVDAFIEHHEPPPPPEVSAPPPAVPPKSAAPAESIEELDWSEILEDGADAVVQPPPMPEAPVEPDLEDFFSELEPGSLKADPGDEAVAWGAVAGDANTPAGDGRQSAEMLLDQDPMTMASGNFTSGYTPPPLAAGHGSISAEILPGDPGSRRRSVARGADPVPAVASVDLGAEDNLDALLDRDFAAWDQPAVPDAPADELHDLINEGLGDIGLGEPIMSNAGIPAEPSLDGPPPPTIDQPLSPPPASAFAPGREEPEFEADFVVAEPPKSPVEPLPEEPSAGKVMRRSSKRKSDQIKPVTREAKVNRDRAPTPVRGFPAIEAENKEEDELASLLKAGLADLDAIERGEQPAGEPPRNRLAGPPPDADLDALMTEARRKLQADDFTGAIEIVEQVLAGDPMHAEARSVLEENTTRLLAMYRSRLGKLSRTPRVKLRPQEITWQSLDHRAGFLLSQIDGRTTYEEIIDISGMSELEASRILARLVEHGVVG